MWIVGLVETEMGLEVVDVMFGEEGFIVEFVRDVWVGGVGEKGWVTGLEDMWEDDELVELGWTNSQSCEGKVFKKSWREWV